MPTEHNERQYRKMLEVLQRYEAGEGGLHRTIADLEALLLSLETPEETWKKSFYREWAVLEDLHASLLDEGLEKLPPDLNATVEQAVVAMRGLIARVYEESH